MVAQTRDDQKTDATGELSKFLLDLDAASLPQPVLSQATTVLADTMGVLLAASREQAMHVAVSAFPLGAGPCTVVGVGHGAEAERAALLNGIAGHDMELDDVHTGSRTHPACVIVPAALAAAELAGDATGGDLLAAIVGGFELEVRASKAMGVQPVVDRGFHLSGVVGAIGAAGAAGRLLRLDQEQMRWAISLAAAQSSGLLSFEEDPSHMLKSFNTGVASRNGVVAAMMTARGYRGAPDVLSGRHNVVTPFGSPMPDYAQFVDELGDRFEIMHTTLKRHACCSQTHAAIDALLELQARRYFSADDVEDIEVELAHDALSMVDHNDLWTHNVQYVLALAARTGWVGREHFSSAWTSDPATADLASRVTLKGNDEVQTRFPQMQGAVVSVTLRDGSRCTTERRAPVGTPVEPMTEEALRSKFFRLAGTVLDDNEASSLWSLLLGVDKLTEIGPLTGALVPGAR